MIRGPSFKDRSMPFTLNETTGSAPPDALHGFDACMPRVETRPRLADEGGSAS
jgi:hypothetical protein